MLTKAEAKSIAENMLDNDEYVILDEHTIDSPSCFCFFWTTKTALDTHDFVVGNAPVIVGKTDREAISTGTALDTQKYIEAYERYRDPHAVYDDCNAFVLISAWREGAKTISATKSVRSAAGCGLATAKKFIESVFEDHQAVIQMPSISAADDLAKRLDSFGFDTRVRTERANQIPDIVADGVQVTYRT